jgi:predicted Zn-dependent protease
MKPRSVLVESDSEQPGTSRKSPRATILLLLALLVIAIAGRVMWSSRVAAPEVHSSVPEFLRAGDEVTLPPAPPLPEDDASKTRERLATLDAFRADYPFRMKDRAFLEAYGMRAASAEDITSAYAAYRVLVENAPEDPTFLNRLAQAENKLGLYRDARLRFEKLVKRSPEVINGHVGLAHALYGLGYRREAVLSLGRASKLLPDNDALGHLFIAKEYETLLNYPGAVAEAKLAWEKTPNDPVVVVVYARILYRTRKVPEAQRLLEDIVERYPDNVPARSTLAQILEHPINPKRDLSAAEHHYLEVLKRARTSVEDCKSLGLLYMQLGRFKQAAFIFTLLLQAEPDNAIGRVQLSKAYAKLGMSKESEEQNRLAARLVSRDTRANELGSRRTERSLSPEDRLIYAEYLMKHGVFGESYAELQAGYAMDSKSARAGRLLKEFDARVGTKLAEFTREVFAQ